MCGIGNGDVVSERGYRDLHPDLGVGGVPEGLNNFTDNR